MKNRSGADSILILARINGISKSIKSIGSSSDPLEVIDGSTVAGYAKKADLHYAANLPRNCAAYNVLDVTAQRNDMARDG